MYTPEIRVLLFVLSLALAYYSYSVKLYFPMFLAISSGGLFVYGYYKYGTVYLAFRKIKKGEYSKAEMLLGKIKNPKTLIKQHKSYYYSKGLIALNGKKWDNSFCDLNKALKLGLRTKNDTSILLLCLAQVELERKNPEQAQEYLKKAKGFDLKPIIQTEADKLQNEINAAQQR